MSQVFPAKAYNPNTALLLDGLDVMRLWMEPALDWRHEYYGLTPANGYNRNREG